VHRSTWCSASTSSNSFIQYLAEQPGGAARTTHLIQVTSRSVLGSPIIAGKYKIALKTIAMDETSDAVQLAYGLRRNQPRAPTGGRVGRHISTNTCRSLRLSRRSRSGKRAILCFFGPRAAGHHGLAWKQGRLYNFKDFGQPRKIIAC
jgi:hypothetical protein